MEVMALFAQQQLKMASDVAAGNIGSHYTVRHCKALVDWHRMSHTVSCI